jgi:hypothetical protein
MQPTIKIRSYFVDGFISDLHEATTLSTRLELRPESHYESGHQSKDENPRLLE